MVKVYCIKCRRHIYNVNPDDIVAGEWRKADIFEPASHWIKAPKNGETIACPVCKQNFMYKNRVLTEMGFLPR